MKTFLQLCIEGVKTADDFDDFVDEWHTGESKIPLHDYLGLTWKEYSEVVLNSDRMRDLIKSKQQEKQNGS